MIVILMGMVVAVIMTVIMFMIMSMRVPMRGQGVIVRHDRSVEQARARLNCCAGGILWRGQEKGAARIGNTGKPFDEPTTQKNPALRVGLRRAPAVSPRSTVFPIRPSRGSWRIAAPQRNAVDFIWSQLALVYSQLVAGLSRALPGSGIVRRGNSLDAISSHSTQAGDRHRGGSDSPRMFSRLAASTTGQLCFVLTRPEAKLFSRKRC